MIPFLQACYIVTQTGRKEYTENQTERKIFYIPAPQDRHHAMFAICMELFIFTLIFNIVEDYIAQMHEQAGAAVQQRFDPDRPDQRKGSNRRRVPSPIAAAVILLE